MLTRLLEGVRELRIARSAVISGRPSESAVAPMIRSAGSFGYDDGNEDERTHIRALIGRTINRVSTSVRKASRLGVKWIRFLPVSKVISRSVMSETASPVPSCLDRSMVSSRSLKSALARGQAR